jgi:asparagine synthase (glutamine-hydrolysing)
MRDYLVIESDVGADPGAWRAAEARVMADGGWTKVAERRRFSVFLEAEHPPPYRHLAGVAGALIGEVFDTSAARQGLGRDLDLKGFGTSPRTSPSVS